MLPKTARSRWTILAVLFVGRVGLSFQFQTMGSVADPLVAELHLSFTEIGTLIGLFMLPGMFLSIPAGFAGRYAPDRILVAAGDTPLHAASVISLASWVMIFSATLCGQVADRTGKSNLIMTVCMLFAIASLLLLPQPGWAVPLSLVFGLIGVAPAGIMMALTGAAMAPQKRAFGMGVFLSVYFLGSAFAPGLAGRMYDRSHDAFLPIVFAASLFGLTLLAYFAFRLTQRSLP